MTARRLMLQGTGSDVGKSVLVAGLCRVFKNRGLTVLPFKPQNMSNNAAATREGGEIGRAQWLQAVAAGAEPHTDMNPVLIKPESEKGAQLVVQGKVHGPIDSGYYRTHKAELLATVQSSYRRLCADADLVLVEGAGSPAEVNLRAGDIANMGFALPTKTPVVLVGDINRGGVIAAIAGTHALLPPEEQALVRGTIINQFRGDVSLFDGGLKVIEEKTGWPNFGVVPFLRAIRELPAEDAVVLEHQRAKSGSKKLVAVPMLPSISNFDDLDPLAADPDIDVMFCPPGTPLPQSADLIILPGSKSTLRDLRFLKDEGWIVDVYAHARAGKPVLGLCGGYQMMGKIVRDPVGIEGAAGVEAGIGLLDVETVLEPIKSVHITEAHCPALESKVSGYEIHMGQTRLGRDAKEYIVGDGRALGAASADGKIMGTYVHGLLHDGEFRAAYLNAVLGMRGPRVDHLDRINATLDTVAEALETCLDVDALWRAAEV
ncbi:MAG: cobyric acid synthase [Kordiimonadaceae bacterium]|nr:cobyric acid synthase [Kordiimonadaceae bacterium]MBO6567580.1 cobyric acid synthase [Kordiimonadaceae bacterium]MBO6963206.1 cobyric acid synthase [Kordiimonadaceae bacterium]